MSILDQLKKLDEQRYQLLENAKKEAMLKVEAGVAELDQLGFSYHLVEGGSSPKKSSGSRNTDPSKKYCSYCEISGHDGRAHRSQGDRKKKFTASELKEMGLN